MGLGNNRDYKTQARVAKAALARHYELMKRYEAQGHSREEASKLAYQEFKLEAANVIREKVARAARRTDSFLRAISAPVETEAESEGICGVCHASVFDCKCVADRGGNY